MSIDQSQPAASLPRAGRVSDEWLPPTTSRLPSLTGLRFAAALLVFANHIGLPFPNLRLLEDDTAAMDLFSVTRNAGALGVTFFFVLSGFVLTWSARKHDTARAFWRRRFVKIYPNYVVAWVLAMALFAAAFTPTVTSVINLLLLQTWVPNFDVFTSVDPPSWSLACEAFFYASFPLLHNLFRRIPLNRLKFWITGTIAAIMLTPVVTYAVLPDTPYFPGGGPQTGAEASVLQYWFAYYLPAVRILDFALGMLIAHAVINGRWRNIGMVWSSLLLAGSYVLCSFVPFLYSQRVVTIIPIAFLIAAAATADVENRFTLFRGRVMIWLGEISFAFYLIHFIVLAYGRQVLGSGYFSVAQTCGLVAAMLVICVAVSWILYALVERPIYRRWASAPTDRSARK